MVDCKSGIASQGKRGVFIVCIWVPINWFEIARVVVIGLCILSATDFNGDDDKVILAKG